MRCMTVAPGWYPDGVTPGVERWFDGTTWHEVTRPVAPPTTGQPYASWGQAYGPTGQSSPPAGQWPAGPPSGQPESWFALGPQDAAHWLVPVGRSWQSITAGYLGLFGLFLFVTAPLAVWLGIWALQVAKRGGHGRGRAWFGIVTGVIGTGLGIWVLTAVLS